MTHESRPTQIDDNHHIPSSPGDGYTEGDKTLDRRTRRPGRITPRQYAAGVTAVGLATVGVAADILPTFDQVFARLSSNVERAIVTRFSPEEQRILREEVTDTLLSDMMAVEENQRLVDRSFSPNQYETNSYVPVGSGRNNMVRMMYSLGEDGQLIAQRSNNYPDGSSVIDTVTLNASGSEAVRDQHLDAKEIADAFRDPRNLLEEITHIVVTPNGDGSVTRDSSTVAIDQNGIVTVGRDDTLDLNQAIQSATTPLR